MAASNRNKCVKCKNAVKDTEEVLVCGLWCRNTFHNECLGLSNREVRAIMCSKVRIKFHCEACEERLAIELLGKEEKQESKNFENGVSLLELVQKLVKLTSELSSDNSTINSKLDTVISSNARLEEYLFQSPNRVETQNEETFNNVVGYAGRRSTKRTIEIGDPNSYTNSNDRRIKSERMCAVAEFPQTEDNLQRIGSDFPEQVADGQHEETFDNGLGYVASCSGQRISEICERNNDQNSHDQIVNSELMCGESEFHQTEYNFHRLESDISEQVADGKHQSFTESYSSNCVQEWEKPDWQDSTQDAPTFVKECVQEWEKPDWQDSTQDAPTFVKEECSPPEDFLTSGTFSIEKTEDVEDEEKSVMEVEGEKYSSSEDFVQPCTLSTEKTKNEEDEIVIEKNFEELKDEVESTATSGKAGSSTTVSVEADKMNEESIGLVTNVFLPARKTNGKQHRNRHEELCANEIGRRNMRHRNEKRKKTFQQLKDLKERTHMDRCEPFTSCNQSHKTFERSPHSKRHIRLLHNGKRPYICSICNKKFPQKRRLTEHKRVHTSERPYSCSICDKKFRQKIRLTEHTRLHTGEHPFSCSFCDKKFRQKIRLTVHTRVHTGERPYSCSICNKTFSHCSSLNRHNRVHTGERPYSCSFCDKKFRQKNCLTVHTRVHTGERPYSCSICNKTFSICSNLDRHNRVHTGERPYSCSYCDKKFRQKIRLTEHTRLHTGERPYSCSFCDKKFRQKIRLKEHTRLHTGELPYSCSICNKTFSDSSSLNRHIRVHTGEHP